MSVHDHFPGIKETMELVYGVEVGGPISHRGARPFYSYRWARRLEAKRRHRAAQKTRKFLERNQ